MPRIRIGLSGWSYRDWESEFYPAGLEAAHQLRFVAELFDAVEINRSFYSLLEPSLYSRWHESVPEGFVFAVKGSRFITHLKKLKDVRVPLGNFLASGVLELGGKLGPLLWQLPAGWRFDPERLRQFLDLLPGNFDEARALASSHDSRVPQVSIPRGHSGPLRHVLEVRDPSFFDSTLIEMLLSRQVALAFSHSSVWRYAEDLTADFVYLRLHGPKTLYSSSYAESELKSWAERITTWHGGRDPVDRCLIAPRPSAVATERDVFVFFDNDSGGHAPRNARRLLDLIGSSA